jgi:hypothetical protein
MDASWELNHESKCFEPDIAGKLPGSKINFGIVYENVGNFTRSSLGTDSNGCPALRQAVRPPTITNVLNPFSRSRCATRALVASRAQVQ